ncbi:MAG: fluoride efflux transporter CrcB [Bacteroidaceae bacterium]
MTASLQTLLTIGVGSFFGGISRYAIGQIVNENIGDSSFPWATFFINVAGCILIGALSAIFHYLYSNHYSWELLLSVGFCGSFTTFSTFINENFYLARTNEIFTAIIYTACSLICGLFALWAAYSFVRNFIC